MAIATIFIEGQFALDANGNAVSLSKFKNTIVFDMGTESYVEVVWHLGFRACVVCDATGSFYEEPCIYCDGEGMIEDESKSSYSTDDYFEDEGCVSGPAIGDVNGVWKMSHEGDGPCKHACSIN